jgi:uncharacterized membrane protein
MTYAEYLDRLMTLEKRVAELTGRVYRLEHTQKGGTDDRFVSSVAPPPRVPESPALTDDENRSSVPLPGFVEPPAPTDDENRSSVPLPRFTEPPAPARRSSAEWEALLGGNLLNKIGAFVLVVGIALALGYSFKSMGPGGRDAVGLAAAAALLGAGMFYERRPRYRTFARGLLGAGWAALYFTVYAMRALEAARVIGSPALAAVLLAAVAAGMIAHALRYQSQTVVGVASGAAFVALAVTEVTPFCVVALVPLAASLLYIARRFRWPMLALFGAIATYATCVSRGDTGTPLWQAQALFATYWLVFEAFDVAAPTAWLLPINAAGFLLLSLLKWNAAAPEEVWMFLAAAAAAWAVSGVLRARLHPEAKPLAGAWHGAATLAAALGAAAILQKLEHEWLLTALFVEAELFYVAGLRFKAGYLRALAIPLFALQLIYLTAVEAPHAAWRLWEPVAAMTAAVFYVNRALRPADTFYGFAAAGVAALIGGYAAPQKEAGAVWFVMAIGPFVLGWWRRLADFRWQGYVLGGLAAVVTAYTLPHPAVSIAIAAAISWGAASVALGTAEGRFDAVEQTRLFEIASTTGAAFLAAFVWKILPESAHGPALAAEALALCFFAGRVRRSALVWQSCAVAAVAFGLSWNNFPQPVSILAGAAMAACFYAGQLLSPRGGPARLYYSLLGTGVISALLYREVSGGGRTVAWGIEGLALLAAGFPLRDRVLRLSGLVLLLFCILKLFIYDLSYLDTLPRIFSFIVLGLILVGVSWIYTRFREYVQRFL